MAEAEACGGDRSSQQRHRAALLCWAKVEVTRSRMVDERDLGMRINVGWQSKAQLLVLETEAVCGCEVEF